MRELCQLFTSEKRQNHALALSYDKTGVSIRSIMRLVAVMLLASILPAHASPIRDFGFGEINRENFGSLKLVGLKFLKFHFVFPTSFLVPKSHFLRKRIICYSHPQKARKHF